jgi:hypothetical protein
MLEFIVLGIIPGTQTQLSPFGVVLLWIALVLSVRFIVQLHRYYRLLEQYEQSALYFILVARRTS